MHNLSKLIISILTISELSILSFTHTTSAEAKVQEQHHSIEKLRWIDTQSISHNKSFKGTTIGGLSGITFNPTNKKWYFISDDRSEKNPARFYEAHLSYDKNKFKYTRFTDVHTLKQANDTTYPSKNKFQKQHNGDVADLESIRFDPNANKILYTSEGDRSLGLNPFIRESDLKGNYKSEIPIANHIKLDNKNKQGFRNNFALEGSSFSPDGQSIWTSMEGPLIQDDDTPNPTSGALTRITQYNRNGSLVSEYAYPLDAVPGTPGAGKIAENGISELLAVNNHEFLTLERASVQSADGAFHNYVRIYKFDTKNATQIKDINSIKDQNVQPVKKKLVANLNESNIGKIDNVEGMTFGKKLENGNDSLVLVTDNNFNESQKTELIAFEVQSEDKNE